MEAKKGFNTFQLKILALIFMLVDHIGQFIQGTPLWFRYIGRLSAPLFCFCLCWGLDFTQNRKKYLARLYIAAFAMAILWCVLEAKFSCYGVMMGQENNIFLSFFIMALLITLLTSYKGKKRIYLLVLFALWQIAALLVSIFILSNILPDVLTAAATGCIFFCEGGIKFCLLGVCLYFAKDNKTKLTVFYLAWCLIFEILLPATALVTRGLNLLTSLAGAETPFSLAVDIIYVLVTGQPLGMALMPGHGVTCQWLEVGALPFMLLYNREKGRSWKRLFYVFYPLHMALLVICADFLQHF